MAKHDGMRRTDEDGRSLRADGLLLLAAVIWGFAFVAQRASMEHVEPLGFNGVRFALGCLALLPLIIRNGCAKGGAPLRLPGVLSMPRLGGSVLAGLVLFAGASFQQVALVSTTAGKAGFITGLYVVLVPLIGVALGHRTHAGTWLGTLLAAFGLYLLSVTEQLTFAPGDLLVLIGACFWAGHVLLIGWLSPRQDPMRLAFVQFAVCSALGLIVSAAIESNTVAGYLSAAIPILYGGVLSVGVAYTLQVVAQKDAKPAHAAIILSLETVFAALGGWLILGEILPPRGLIGCALMFAAMLASQLWRPPRTEAPDAIGG
jgi:drug/metabolite transporter (DMT)-like permease